MRSSHRRSAKARLKNIEDNYADAEANVSKALELARDCGCAYRKSSDKVRRQFNQVLFRRLLIDDPFEVTGELEEPFETLLSVRQVTAVTSEADLQRILDEGDPGEDVDDALACRLVLTGAVYSKSDVAPPLVGRLQKKKGVSI
jgi:hypothetical protein